MDNAPRLAGLPLGRSGAAFELDHPASANTRVRVGTWQVSTSKGSAIVVARGRVGSYETALSAAIPKAEQALDKLSVRGIDDLVLAGADHEHLAWWPSETGTTLRIVSTSFQTLSIMNLEVTVRDANGHIVRPAPPRPVPWHPSFRFFRLSQTTSDLFDAYRNAYLALEAILADQTPQRRKGPGQKGEQDTDWFRRALIATGVDLAAFVATPLGAEADALYDAIYRDVRVRAFHAKPDRDSLLPRDRATAAVVEAGLKLTRQVYLAIVEANLGVGRLAGGYSSYAASAMAAAILEDIAFVATSDESRFDADAGTVSPAAEPECSLANVLPPEYSGFTASRRAWATGADLASLPFVRRVVGVSAKGQPYVQTRLEGRLEQSGISRLEVEFRIVMRNARELSSGLT
jgi:hypothetical protein